MGLETNVNTIADLNPANPAQSDGVSQGDNHLRMIKAALKATFPNIDKPITRDADSLNQGIPSGVITMWSGDSLSVPEGWTICDGNNGTPNLQEKFIVGAGPDSKYDFGNTGGADSVTLNTGQIPSHDHGDGNLSTTSNGRHRHNGRTSGGGIDFSFSLPAEDDSSQMMEDRYNISHNTMSDKGLKAAMERSGNKYRDKYRYDANHDHYFNTNYENDHSHGVNGRTSNTGGGNSHENRPPYYALCFIMKL